MGDKKKPGIGFGVMMLKDGKVLLGQRHPDPEKASSKLHGEGSWTMPGGKLDFGETLAQGAVRELLEETGMKTDVKNLKIMSVADEILEDVHFVTVGFLCEKFEGTPSVMEPDEITQWGWFDLDNLPKPMFFPSEKVIKNYLDGELYKN